MKQDYYCLTKSCIWEKDIEADQYQQEMISYADRNNIEYKLNYKKEMADVKKVGAIKTSVVDSSLYLDKLLHKFKMEIPRIILKECDNYIKYVEMCCNRYRICNDLQNIILSFIIDKRYNREKREMRKQKKILCKCI